MRVKPVENDIRKTALQEAREILKELADKIKFKRS